VVLLALRDHLLLSLELLLQAGELLLALLKTAHARRKLVFLSTEQFIGALVRLLPLLALLSEGVMLRVERLPLSENFPLARRQGFFFDVRISALLPALGLEGPLLLVQRALGGLQFPTSLAQLLRLRAQLLLAGGSQRGVVGLHTLLGAGHLFADRLEPTRLLADGLKAFGELCLPLAKLLEDPLTFGVELLTALL